MNKISVALVFSVILSYNVINGIILEVVANQERCIYDEFKPDTLVTGTVKVTPNVQTHQLHMKITDVANQPVYENGNVNEATFAFTVQQEEEYAFCFTDRTNYYGENQPPRLVEIKMEHQKEKDYSDIAKKENLKPIEVELRKIEDAVEQLKGDFAYMKNREARHRNTNESTNSRVMWMSLLSVAILVGLAGFQMYYLKKYFKSKKLI